MKRLLVIITLLMSLSSFGQFNYAKDLAIYVADRTDGIILTNTEMPGKNIGLKDTVYVSSIKLLKSVNSDLIISQCDEVIKYYSELTVIRPWEERKEYSCIDQVLLAPGPALIVMVFQTNPLKGNMLWIYSTKNDLKKTKRGYKY